MGEVYLAKDTSLDRLVALKILSSEIASDAQRMKRFVQEAKLASNLNHPNILTVYDVGSAEGARFIAAEYVEGMTLRQRLTQGALLLLDALGVITQVAAALAAAHKAGIVHRDIKPENIMLREDGYVKVLDFGLAKLLAPQSGSTEADTQIKTTPNIILGTLYYMSPEQARGLETDTRTDIWSLGVVLYEVLTGRVPFRGQTRTDVLVSIIEREPPPLASGPAGVASELESIVSKALRKDRNGRYQTMSEMIVALRKLKRELEFKIKLRTSVWMDENAETVFLDDKYQTDQSREAIVAPIAKQTRKQSPNNLPAQLTAIIGRAAEIDAVVALLREEGTRLVTLTGPGGTGKTRLALEVAARLLDDFPDGVFFVALAPIKEPALVASAIAQILEVREKAGLSTQESLKEQLKERQMLLLLDNFEQIISAAPFVTELLASCPKLKILVSSRAVLRLRGEREFAVPPLALPDVDRLSGDKTLVRCSAVELFVQRARAVKPDFALNAENARAVAEVCIRLDGLPLAIELAASRIKLLAPQAISARLDNRLKFLTGGARDLPARQQTIRETIAWSYDLLDEDEKTLFRRLSVFVGGLSLEAAEQVSGGAGDLQTDVLEGLASLIDKSLLRQRGQEISGPRFGMLETIREYGLERLHERGERDALQGRHAHFFLKMAEDAELGVRGPEQVAWYSQLEAEHNNMRSALEWFQSQADAESGLRLVGALWWFWWRRGYLTEGRERLLSVLSRTNTSVPSVGLVKALCGAGFLSLLQGDYTSAASFGAQSVKIARELDDKFLTAYTLLHYGVIIPSDPASTPDSSISTVEEALKLFREVGNKWGVATALNYLGELLRSQGDYSRAAPVYEESLAINVEIGNTWAVVTSSVNLAWVALHQGDYKRAQALFKQALIPARDLKAPYIVSENLMALADVAIQAGDAKRAARLLGASAGLSETTGYVLNPFDRKVFDHYVAAARDALGEKEFSSAWAEGHDMTFEQAITYALASTDSAG